MLAEIEKLKNGIVQKFNPVKILLFGSHAKNSAGKDSDIDICIVADVDDKKDFRKKITMFIYDDIEGLDFDKPVDILLYTTRNGTNIRDKMGRLQTLFPGRALFSMADSRIANNQLSAD